MVKAAEPGTGDHRRGGRRLAFHWPAVRCVLIERIVNPVVVMIVHVVANGEPGIAGSIAPAPRSTGCLTAKPPVASSATKGTLSYGHRPRLGIWLRTDPARGHPRQIQPVEGINQVHQREYQ